MAKPIKLYRAICEDRFLLLFYAFSIFLLTRLSLVGYSFQKLDLVIHLSVEVCLAVAVFSFIKGAVLRFLLIIGIHFALFLSLVFVQYFSSGINFVNLNMSSLLESKTASESLVVFMQSPNFAATLFSLFALLIVTWIGRHGKKIPLRIGAVSTLILVSIVIYEVAIKQNIYNTFSYVDSRSFHNRIGIIPTLTAQALTAPKLLPAEMPVTTPLPVDSSNIPLRKRVLIIQVESLDHEVIDFQYQGKAVTPFLNELKSKGVYFPMKPRHVSGSSDADFVMLTGLKPMSPVAPYKLPAQTYSNTLPIKAGRVGYQFRSHHGFQGNFFDRKAAYRKMGFSQFLFLEDYEQSLRHPESWGIPDHVVFQNVGKQLSESQAQTVDFIITLDSHLPFRHKGYYPEVFPKNDFPGRYFNSMRYVDNQLKELLESSKEPLTVIIYGDHSSCIAYGKQKGCMGWDDWRREPRKEVVPAIIVDTKLDISGLQYGYSEISMYDFAAFTHRLFASSRTIVP